MAGDVRLERFVLATTRLGAPPLVPEIRLHLADEVFGVWERGQHEIGPNESPPFWAFAWAGGQALARYLFDHPEVVAHRRVFDIGAGGGIVAIAAAKLGAVTVTANDTDACALAAIGLNAAVNGVSVTGLSGDVLASAEAADGAEVVLAGDVFYEQPAATVMMGFLARASDRGATVLVGDPGRAHLPVHRFEALAAYDVPVSAGLEGTNVKRTTVLRLLQ
jgi:predicted nicotinamide N-methyase